MVEKFLSEKQPTSWSPTDGNLPTSVLAGLRAAKWPGRCQKLVDPKDTSLTWFLDGAHTEESLKCCLEWYVSPEAGLMNKDNPK
jgi:folylpolyglutamate synthase